MCFLRRLFDTAIISYEKEYETDALMLFDLSKDLGEENDLAKSQPELTARMHDRLNDYLAEIGAKVPTKNPDYDPKNDKGLNNRSFPGRQRPGGAR